MKPKSTRVTLNKMQHCVCGRQAFEDEGKPHIYCKICIGFKPYHEYLKIKTERDTLTKVMRQALVSDEPTPEQQVIQMLYYFGDKAMILKG